MSRQTTVNNINYPKVSTPDVKNLFTVGATAVTERRSRTRCATACIVNISSKAGENQLSRRCGSHG